MLWVESWALTRWEAESSKKEPRLVLIKTAPLPLQVLNCIQEFLQRKYGSCIQAGQAVKKISPQNGDPRSFWEYYISDCKIFQELFEPAFADIHLGSTKTWEKWQCLGTVRELPGGIIVASVPVVMITIKADGTRARNSSV
eukprot:750078-Pleurochrysis_carterae.AAC.1